MNAIRRFLVVLIASAGLAGATDALANLEEDGTPFIGSLGTRAIAVFADDSTSRQEKAERFNDLFHEGFAVKSLAVFTLGRYRERADAAFLEDYVDAFADYIVLTYSARFTSFSGETFEVTGSRPDTDGNGTVAGAWIQSVIRTPGGNPIRVDWRLRELRGEPIIVDVFVEGVSMAITQQKEFISVIANNGGDVTALLDIIREKNAELLAD